MTLSRSSARRSTGAAPAAPPAGPAGGDNAALRAIAAEGGALCTVIAIDGSFSRRLGAQLAVLPGGRTIGSLADGCLEAMLAREATALAGRKDVRLLSFGGPEDPVDFRLPCGSALSVAIDPAPDMAAVRAAVAQLDARQAAQLPLPLPDGSRFLRAYRPALRIVAAGSGPELDALEAQAAAFGAEIEVLRPIGEHGAGATLALGEAPRIALDRWTALVALFHDHEWERTLLPWALASKAFYVGAQGGAAARAARAAMLAKRGVAESALARLHSPVGLIAHARDPAVLALSVLAEIVADYEAQG